MGALHPQRHLPWCLHQYPRRGRPQVQRQPSGVVHRQEGLRRGRGKRTEIPKTPRQLPLPGGSPTPQRQVRQGSSAHLPRRDAQREGRTPAQAGRRERVVILSSRRPLPIPNPSPSPNTLCSSLDANSPSPPSSPGKSTSSPAKTSTKTPSKSSTA